MLGVDKIIYILYNSIYNIISINYKYMLFKGSPAKELKKRNKLIIKLIKKGVRKEQIAVRFDIGISRVYQIWNKR
ncbi:hypothetical protein CL633_04385 [bacterium]|nr:hypothetical protein [bacterium]